MGQIKLHLKLGSVEVQYEGSEEFAETGIFPLIQQISELDLQDIVSASVAAAPGVALVDLPSQQDSQSKLSTSDFAVKLGSKSGTDLVMAAAAYLHHTAGMEEFRRADIMSAMKGARAFYRASYGSNLSKSLESLTKSGRLLNPRPETYALAYPEVESTQRLLK